MTFPRVFYRILYLLPVVFLLFSCDSKRFYEDNKKIAHGVWNRNDKIRFGVTIPDTVAIYNFYLNVRNDLDYPYANLYFFIDTRLPAGTISRDTVECQLADYTGRWFGKGIGSVKFNRFPLSEKFPFPAVRDVHL